jgi:hypothetical protein
LIPEEEVSALRRVETSSSFCYDDEEERAGAEAASRMVRERICWAETVWANTEKRKALQWVGYLDGREAGYVVVDLGDRAIRAYAKSEVEYRLIGRFGDAPTAQRAVMFEVVELPVALCKAFGALIRFRTWAREYILEETVRQFNARHHSRTRASITG